ncbi:type 2 glycerol-3-phosphate oxidase [Mycoplasma phocimorsus]|uniref:type 2 glycerol-3-phosphate oxidase n=1 Tax=Mycoplasma phocimorsus TaxID=3045839 RepID=UPI0024BFDC58|nr:type 2 glycerol-3-phosphate oxidase [Mycoplasma phocimorsus]MDJ1646363.1 type 2 glycerol-3-phosphate oxidase [Mycoplasma phocimorsus]MDJ1647072.1 type 2 glycerol-3-phosphate oxidase [Mycoplasma phocimorsus]MDJ1649157.1 type 2 glycerol-3-phosphate oxidase [Mycoplasma phocimorsus]
MKKYDITIIGGGIIGGTIAYELSQYKLNTIVLEKNPLFADETSKANSGAIHGGFDPEPHKIEAKLNVLGNELWRTKIFKDLEFPKAQLDSLILAFNEEEMEHVHMLYERGLVNKVPKEFLKVISKEEVLAKEPNVNPNVVGALLCTSSWAIDPVRATYAFMGASEQNGTELKTNAEVIDIKYINDIFELTLKNGEKIYSKVVINAAGHYADILAEKAGYGDFKQTTRRGEYRILARSEAGIVNSICFKVPTIHGKGVIVAPMLDGRVLVGPTAEEGVPKEETRLVTKEKFDYIGKIGTEIIPTIRLQKTEMTLAGSRPIDIETNDFIIRSAKENKKWINAAGMQSPAIASSPAIAIEIAKLVEEAGIKLEKDLNYNPKFKVEF